MNAPCKLVYRDRPGRTVVCERPGPGLTLFELDRIGLDLDDARELGRRCARAALTGPRDPKTRLPLDSRTPGPREPRDAAYTALGWHPTRPSWLAFLAGWHEVIPSDRAPGRGATSAGSRAGYLGDTAEEADPGLPRVARRKVSR